MNVTRLYYIICMRHAKKKNRRKKTCIDFPADFPIRRLHSIQRDFRRHVERRRGYRFGAKLTGYYSACLTRVNRTIGSNEICKNKKNYSGGEIVDSFPRAAFYPLTTILTRYFNRFDNNIIIKRHPTTAITIQLLLLIIGLAA